MGGVRALLRKAFDELWIIDLGGEGRGALVEENIFDILTPVAIAVGIRAHQPRAGDCRIRYLRITGTRLEKLARLKETSLGDVSSIVPGEGLDRMTPRSDSQYYDWPEITDLFPWSHSGCQAKRTWPIAESKILLVRRWQELLREVPRQRASLLRETGYRTTASQPSPLLGTGCRLRPLNDLDHGDEPQGFERYGYRSLDRQWVIADQRLLDRPRPDLWRVRGPRQVFLTTLTSTKLGRGPVLTVTPYVPDLHHFRGRGAKDVMPLYRGPERRTPNVTEGLLLTLTEWLGTEISAEDLLGYVYALTGTDAFSERFEDELAEAAGPIHIPITANPALFRQGVALGQDLLWWHTWGERFSPAGQTRLTPSRAQQLTPVNEMPETFTYDPDTQCLTVGSGAFSPVSTAVWDFEVSGLKVLPSWLGYRMKTRKGRKSSPLEDIRPARWTQTQELLRLLAILEHTTEVTPTAAGLLDEILARPLILSTDLPTPTPDQRKPLKPQ